MIVTDEDAAVATPTEPLIKIEDLEVQFPIRGGFPRRQVGAVRAVDGVTLDIRKGETLGLVGESGCGKSTLGKAILRLIEPTSGRIMLDGDPPTELVGLRTRELREVRRRAQIVFQDPYSSLNPAVPVFESLRRGLAVHSTLSRSEQRHVLEELFEKVNLRPEYLDRYPHEFSGGQRQRIAIVRALSVDPEFVVCDEAVSALDVSVQAQVLELLRELKEDRDLTYLFISHNLSVVEYVADRIAVMYLGRIVELTDAESLYTKPLHPYTQALLSAIPVTEVEEQRERIVLTGDVPSPASPPSGCPFHPRCPIAIPACATIVPTLRELSSEGGSHQVACERIEDAHGRVR